MMLPFKKSILCCIAIQLFLITPSILYAASCSNNWLRPSLQTMETEIVYATLTEYTNGERYLFIKQGKSAFDVFYLRGALLVKGLDDSQLNYDTIWQLPMMFMPMAILSQAVPQGPCSITQKTPFSLPEAEGEITPISQGVIRYEYALKDTKTADTTPRRFRGTMQFTPSAAAPSEDADVKGYKLVGRTKPYPVLGSAGMPATTIRELRRVEAAKAKAAKKDPLGQAMKEQALDAVSKILGQREPIPDTMKVEDIIMSQEEITHPKDSNELYPLQIGNKWGYVNKVGCVVIEPRFSLAFFFEGRLARVHVNYQWGVIDKTGRFIIEPQYGGIGRFRDGLASVKKNEKVGFINEAGKIIVPIEGDSKIMPEYKNGVAIFLKNGNPFYVDKNGTYITRDQFCQKTECYNYNRIHPVGKDGKWGLVDAKNELILKPQYDHINHEKDGLFLVKKNDRYGFIDKMGNLVIDLQFEGAHDFKDGFAGVKKNGKYGFIDKTGRFVIEPQFDYVRPFEDGIAPVSINNKWGLIDMTGRYIAEPQFENGYFQAASFKDGVGTIKKNGKWGLIDRTGKILIEPQFDGEGPSFFNGLSTVEFATVAKDHKSGVVHKSGRIIITPQYTNITIYPNFAHPNAPNVFQVSKYPHNGYVDTSGHLFVLTDKVCGHDVVKNGKGEITWPRNIKELCL